MKPAEYVHKLTAWMHELHFFFFAEPRVWINRAFLILEIDVRNIIYVFHSILDQFKAS